MKIRKRRLSNLLAVVLVVSSLAPSGMMVSASAAEADSVYQEEETKLQETLTATESNAGKQNTKTKMLESRSGMERAAEASGTCGENLTWILEEGVLIISGTGEMENWYWHGNYGLAKAPWYDNKDEIISVVISDGVTSIGNSAFCSCNSLTSIEIPASVTSIGNDAFENCSSLTSIEIPISVTSIGDSAFYGCSSLTSIGDSAFYGCSSLTSIEIPTSVTSIGNSAFYDCSSLTSIEIPTSVTSIKSSAFENCSSLTSIEIPTSITSIELFTFYGCSNLTSIEIPTSVTSIGNDAFNSCTALSDVYYKGSESDWENITIESDNDPLINAAIHYNNTDLHGTCGENLTWILKNGVLTISGTGEMENYWYESDGLREAPWYDNRDEIISIVIGDGVTSIGDNAFDNCDSLTSIEIPTSVTSIGDFAFYYCSSLTSIEIPTSVTSIGNRTFDGCIGLTSIEIPTSVTSIGNAVFSFCISLTSIEIPTSVTSIGDYAFYACNSLTSIEIPTSVTSIGDSAYGCTALSDVYYKGSESDWKNITIESGNDPLINATIHYNNDPGNISFNIGSLDDAVLYVPYSAFLKLDNAPEGSQPTFRISDGTLPEGLELNESTGEISGMPTKAGEFKIIIEAVFSESQDVSVSAEATIKVKENTDVNIDNSSDKGYEVLQYVGDKTEQGYVMTQYTDQTFVSSGDFGEFIALWLNGQKLIEDEDYTKEEGSTRITIRSQTFKTKTRPGSNTLSAAFKNKKNQLKRTSQNFIVDIPKKDDTGTSNGNGSSNSGRRKSRHRSDGTITSDNTDINLYNDDSWVKDEIGWRCKMPDGNWITNTWFRLPYQGTVEWYYFNEQGYMATGLFEKNGLLYYLNPISDGTQGKMITGWEMIDGKWYYFKEIDDGTRGAMMSDVWIGEYYINSQGVWEE